MSKKVSLYVMIGGIVVSAYDAFTNNSLYGPGKPLEKLRFKVYTGSNGSNWYVSVSDIAAVLGAIMYFKKG